MRQMTLEDEAHTLLNRVDALRHPCDLDLLVFFVKHPNTLMASEQLATFMGYDIKQLAESLEVLLAAELVTRSQSRGQVARMYVLSSGGIHGGWLPALVALASTRAGRIALHRELKKRSSGRTRERASRTEAARSARPPRPVLVGPPDVLPSSEPRKRRRGGE